MFSWVMESEYWSEIVEDQSSIHTESNKLIRTGLKI